MNCRSDMNTQTAPVAALYALCAVLREWAAQNSAASPAKRVAAEKDERRSE